MDNHTATEVTSIPPCDLHDDGTAAYADARLPAYGSWGNLCKAHFDTHRCTLGLGNGQRFVLVLSDTEM